MSYHKPHCECGDCVAQREFMRRWYTTIGKPALDPYALFKVADLAPKTLEERVAEDIETLTAGLDGWAGKPELPSRPLDLTRYEDAVEFAMKNCTHENIHDILHQREWVCEDCGAHFNGSQIREFLNRKRFRWFEL